MTGSKPVKKATRAGVADPGGAKPLVLSWSTTTDPEKAITRSVAGIATGSSCQLARSVLTAWPQLMWPHWSPCGLYW